MLKILKNRLEQGHRTVKYPKQPLTLYERFRGLPEVNRNCSVEIIRRCAEACPQAAINAETGQIDLGRCLFCGLCENLSAGEFVRFSQDFELAVTARDDLVTHGDLPVLAEHSQKHFKRLFGRSLQLRQISAGGCNACEGDINVLNTPFFDLSRFGIQYVASPRHADGIHVTGPISNNMRQVVLTTYAAVPSPKVVIAGGACAISGGPFFGSDEIVGDLNQLLPVDLYIPGCPPHPLTTLHALLNFFK